tara:strand:- start:43 stop:705 length:663 start_codon:yes stop_codon:yes gene_type:complete
MATIKSTLTIKSVFPERLNATTILAMEKIEAYALELLSGIERENKVTSSTELQGGAALDLSALIGVSAKSKHYKGNITARGTEYSQDSAFTSAYYTDGTILLRKDKVVNASARKQLAKINELREMADDEGIKSIIKTAEGRVCARLKFEELCKHREDTEFPILTANNETSAFNAELFAFVLKATQFDQIRQAEPMTPGILYRDGQFVGLIMPVQLAPRDV